MGAANVYDEVLCKDYWEYLGWDSPAESKNKIEISNCNYYCSACGEENKKYCTSDAWHTDSSNYSDHNFNCRKLHKEINGVDVQFIIDTTQSMKKYSEVAINTIEGLIKAT